MPIFNLKLYSPVLRGIKHTWLNYAVQTKLPKNTKQLNKFSKSLKLENFSEKSNLKDTLPLIKGHLGWKHISEDIFIIQVI